MVIVIIVTADGDDDGRDSGNDSDGVEDDREWSNACFKLPVYETIFVLFRKQDSTTSCSHLLRTLHQFISVWHLILTSTRLVGLVI